MFTIVMQIPWRAANLLSTSSPFLCPISTHIMDTCQKRRTVVIMQVPWWTPFFRYHIFLSIDVKKGRGSVHWYKRSIHLEDEIVAWCASNKESIFEICYQRTISKILMEHSNLKSCMSGLHVLIDGLCKCIYHVIGVGGGWMCTFVMWLSWRKPLFTL